jgi:mycothiol synthase
VRLPQGYASRSAGPEDLDVVVSIFKACDLADVGVEDPVRDHIEDEWKQASSSGLAALLVEAPDAAVAGYAEVHGFNPELSVEGFVRVHPDHRARGLGAALLGWTEERAAEMVPAGATSTLRNAIPGTDEPARRLLLASGYRQVRTFWHMVRALDDDVAAAAPPDGITIRGYVPDDLDALYDAVEEAFSDHWGFEPYPREAYLEEMERADPALCGVALDGDEVVGGLFARLVEGTGWIDMIAIRRPWRGRGLAKAMLLQWFGVLRARGARSVMLNVDPENATGAPRLYERVGMRVHREWRLFEKPLVARED